MVNPNLIDAIIKVESNGNPLAVSKKMACGLMQLMPATFDEWANICHIEEADIFNPEHNRRVGERYFHWLLGTFPETELALAAYNYGCGNIWRIMRREQIKLFSEIEPHLPEETKEYVTKVMDFYRAKNAES